MSVFRHSVDTETAAEESAYRHSTPRSYLSTGYRFVGGSSSIGSPVPSKVPFQENEAAVGDIHCEAFLLLNLGCEFQKRRSMRSENGWPRDKKMAGISLNMLPLLRFEQS